MKRQIWKLGAAGIRFVCIVGALYLMLKTMHRHSSSLEHSTGIILNILISVPICFLFVLETPLFVRSTTDLWKRRMAIAFFVISATFDVPMFFRPIGPSASEVIAEWSNVVVPQVAAFMCGCMMVDVLYKRQIVHDPPPILARLVTASVTLGIAHWGWIPILAGLPAFGTAVSLICKIVFLFVQLTTLNAAVPQGVSDGRLPAFNLRKMWYSTLMMSTVYCAFPLISLGAFEAVRHIAR